MEMNSIDALTLKQKINNKEDFLLINVREPAVLKLLILVVC